MVTDICDHIQLRIVHVQSHSLLSFCLLFSLQERIKTAKRRVVIASLYLGTGQLEQELVRKVVFVYVCPYQVYFLFFLEEGAGENNAIQTQPHAKQLVTDARKCESFLFQEDRSRVCSEWMCSAPTTRNDLKIQGFMGIRRPVLACDSQLFFMHGKPSITTLTQSKPQSGLTFVFSCFSCFSLNGSSSSREGELQKKAETSQTRLIAVKSFRISCDYCQTL